MDTGRLESFSDGVFAVAITLLVFGSAYRRLAPAGQRAAPRDATACLMSDLDLARLAAMPSCRYDGNHGDKEESDPIRRCGRDAGSSSSRSPHGEARLGSSGGGAARLPWIRRTRECLGPF